MKNDRSLSIGTWITIGSPIVSEIISSRPFDWLLFDLEHGFLTEDLLLTNLQAVKTSNAKLIVRIPNFNPSLISRALDWGASGIMMPHVGSAEQARLCVEALTYPPEGKRSYTSENRVFDYGLNARKDVDRQRPTFFAQIESYEGTIGVGEIAKIEGVDVLFVGPSDLAFDLKTSQNYSHLTLEDAVKMISEAALKNAKQAGIFISRTQDIPYYLDLGFTCFGIKTDIGILNLGYDSIFESLNLLPISIQKTFHAEHPEIPLE